jgi:WD40 repeat protein
LATGSYDWNAILWDSQTLERRHVFKGHAGPIQSLAFSPDGGRLVTASHDRTVKLWHLPSRQQVLTLREHEGQVLAAAFSRTGRVLATGGRDRTVRLHHAPVRSSLLLASYSAIDVGRRIRSSTAPAIAATDGQDDTAESSVRATVALARH